jgi:hypothetical protein
VHAAIPLRRRASARLLRVTAGRAAKPSVRGAKRRSIPAFAFAASGLLRFARNDGARIRPVGSSGLRCVAEGRLFPVRREHSPMRIAHPFIMIAHVIGSLCEADVGRQSAGTIKLGFRFRCRGAPQRQPHAHAAASAATSHTSPTATAIRPDHIDAGPATRH